MYTHVCYIHTHIYVRTPTCMHKRDYIFGLGIFGLALLNALARARVMRA